MSRITIGSKVKLNQKRRTYTDLLYDWEQSEEVRGYMTVTQIRDEDGWLRFDNQAFNKIGSWWNQECFVEHTPSPTFSDEEDLFKI